MSAKKFHGARVPHFGQCVAPSTLSSIPARGAIYYLIDPSSNQMKAKTGRTLGCVETRILPDRTLLLNKSACEIQFQSLNRKGNHKFRIYILKWPLNYANFSVFGFVLCHEVSVVKFTKMLVSLNIAEFDVDHGSSASPSAFGGGRFTLTSFPRPRLTRPAGLRASEAAAQPAASEAGLDSSPLVS